MGRDPIYSDDIPGITGERRKITIEESDEIMQLVRERIDSKITGVIVVSNMSMSTSITIIGKWSVPELLGAISSFNVSVKKLATELLRRQFGSFLEDLFHHFGGDDDG